MNRDFTNLTLVKKIIAVIVLTTLVSTITVIPVIYFTLKDGMQSQRQRHLIGVKHLVERLIEDNRRTVKNYALLFSSDRQIKDNLYYFAELAGERVHPLNAIKHLVKTFDLQFIELGDRYGRVVANAIRADQNDRDKAQDTLIRKALNGASVTDIETYGDGFLLKAVAPIFHDESQLIGTISTGMLMNNDFARMIKSLSGVEIVIIGSDQRLVASTFSTRLPRDSLRDLKDTVTIESKRYQLMQLPLNSSSGLPLGSVLIMAEDNMSPILRRASLMVISVLFAVSILSIAATVFILRRVLAPVRELRQGAEKIGSGRFNHRITVTSTDEIGNLARVFNRMAANLQQMREVEERLKHSERLASIGEFTAATAHEINNPIANIIGLLKVVRRELPSGSAFADDLAVVIKEANRCGAIVRDLLMYSRSSRPIKEKTEVGALVRESIAKVNERHKKTKNITVNFNNPTHEIWARLDPGQIEQVIRNILTNAFQAIQEEGMVGIDLNSQDGKITITISDDGCGIAATDLDNIFYPFFTTKKSCEGTGLGLAVCYTIIQSHNGNISVTSELGAGSEFTLTLPVEGDDG